MTIYANRRRVTAKALWDIPSEAALERVLEAREALRARA